MDAKTKRRQTIARMRALLDDAEAAGRNLTESERREYETLERDVDRLELELRRGFDPRRSGSPFHGDREGKQPDVLGPEQRMVDWVRERSQRRDTSQLDDVDGQFSLGRVLTALVNRDRRHLNEFEKRALVEGVDASGGYLLPQILSAEVVDRLRPFTRVLQAGASIVPMETEYLLFARLTGGVTPAWKSEGDTIVDQSMTFDRITLQAKTLPLLVKISQELFDDLSPEASEIIEGELLKALAIELDRVILRGSGVSPEPLGILNTSGVTLQPLKTGSSSANGGSLSGYDDVATAIASIRRNNLEPNAVICSARVAGDFDRMKNAIADPLLRPPSVQGIWPPLVSNIVPDNITVGNANTCSEIYVGQWDQCLVGMRTDIRVGIRALDQRFADQLEVGLLVYLRGDVALRHGEAFTVITGILPFSGD